MNNTKITLLSAVTAVNVLSCGFSTNTTPILRKGRPPSCTTAPLQLSQRKSECPSGNRNSSSFSRSSLEMNWSISCQAQSGRRHVEEKHMLCPTESRKTSFCSNPDQRRYCVTSTLYSLQVYTLLVLITAQPKPSGCLCSGWHPQACRGPSAAAARSTCKLQLWPL